MKAIRTLLLVVASCLLSLSTFADPQCGDVNADGLIDPGDALLVQRHSFGLLTLTPNQLTRADVDGSGVVDFNDVIRILQYFSGAPVTLDCAPIVATNLYVATFSPPRLVVLDAVSHAVVSETLLSNTPTSIANDPTRDRVYISTWEGALIEFDTNTNAITRMLKVPGLFGAIEVTCDGSKLVGVTHAGIVVVALPKFQVSHEVLLGSGHYGPGFIALAPDSKSVWVSETNIGQISEVSLGGSGIKQTIDVGFGPTGLAVSLDGTRVFVANNQEHSLSIVDTQIGSEIAVEPTGTWPLEVILHSSGKVYVAGSFGASITEHDAAGLTTSVFSLALDPFVLHEVRGTGVITGAPLSAPSFSLLDPGTGLETGVDFTLLGVPVDVTSH